MEPQCAGRKFFLPDGGKPDLDARLYETFSVAPSPSPCPLRRNASSGSVAQDQHLVGYARRQESRHAAWQAPPARLDSTTDREMDAPDTAPRLMGWNALLQWAHDDNLPW